MPKFHLVTKGSNLKKVVKIHKKFYYMQVLL